MSESKGFTAGPWAVHRDSARVIPAEHADRPIGSHSNPAIDRAKYAQEICAMHWPDRNRAEAEVKANACLIAAAPELYAALILAREYLSDDSHYKAARDLHAICSEALAKAAFGNVEQVFSL